MRAQLRILASVSGVLFLLPLSRPAEAQDVFITKVTDDRPWATRCEGPLSFANPTEDVNNMPQAEVWIDVSEEGRLAACAKDYRYGPIDDTTYNARVWNGFYFSTNAGERWRNRLFHESDPNRGIVGVTSGAYGMPAGVEVRLNHESDPVLSFDRDGNLYTCGLAFDPLPESRPSAIVVSRRDRNGNLQATRFIGLENDARLFNDKNWLAVDRSSPRETTVVIASLRLFVSEEDSPVMPGGYVAVSADGAGSFGAPLRLPVPLAVANESQYYQPLIGPDPVSGHKTLFIMFRTIDTDNNYAMAMHFLKADIDGLSPGTEALDRHLANDAHWTYLQDRITGLYAFGSGGYDGSFRFNTYFHPAIDRETGHLYAVAHAFDLGSQGSRIIVTKSTDGGETWTSPKDVDNPGRGYQFMSTVAVHSGVVSLLWYDSRNDEAFAPFELIQGIDVMYAELDTSLQLKRVLRLTPDTQVADHPVFTRDRPEEGALSPLMQPEIAVSQRREPGPLGPMAQTIEDCNNRRYGFIGDYLGIAANREFAYVVWTDLRDLNLSDGICAGHSCNGRRNQNVYFARIRK